MAAPLFIGFLLDKIYAIGEVTLQGTSASIFCAPQVYYQYKFDDGNRRFPISLMTAGTNLGYALAFFLLLALGSWLETCSYCAVSRK